MNRQQVAEAKPDPRAPIDVLPTERVAFHQAEFHALKAEIAELVKQTYTYFTFAITASAAIAVWILTHGIDDDAARIAAWMPLAVTAGFAVMTYATYVRIGEKGDYLGVLEMSLGANGLGWQQYFNKRAALIGRSVMAAWCALIIADLAAIVVLPTYAGSATAHSGVGSNLRHAY